MLNPHIFAGFEPSKEQSIAIAIGIIIGGIVLIVGSIVIFIEIIRAIKMFIKGSKKVRRGILKRSGIVLLIILGFVLVANIIAR